LKKPRIKNVIEIRTEVRTAKIACVKKKERPYAEVFMLKILNVSLILVSLSTTG
jgi:hypothetical protein